MEFEHEKVFIVSLDGATFDVLNPLVSQGYMPNLNAMLSRGASAELESVVPPVTAPAWTSFMTGKHPSKHDVFDFTRFDPTDYSWSINNAHHIRSKTIWQILSEKGKRVIVLNLPYTYPPSEVNGIMVSGWDAPLQGEKFSHPAHVGEHILQTFPDYKANLWVSDLQPLQSEEQFCEFTRRLKAGFEQQARVALELLAQEQWDVFMVHFQQTDWIQHKLWKYIERACRYPEDHSPKVEDTRNCYRYFDNVVGLLLKEVESTKVSKVLLSDHGFGRLMGNIYPNYYLKEWGYLSLKVEVEDRLLPVKNLLRKSRHKSLRKLYRTLANAKYNLAGGEQQHQSWSDNTGNVLSGRGTAWDWTKTQAATIYAYQMGFVFVNLVGRGPNGIVELGIEYDRLIADLSMRFRGLRHPFTGEKLLEDVVKGVDIYPVAEDILIPDLVLVPANGYGFSFSISDSPPEVSDEGTHRHNGVLVVESQFVRRIRKFGPNLVDIAPTVLHMLDVPVPTDMDGRVLSEIFSTTREVRYEQVDNSIIQAAQAYNTDDQQLIEQRLKGLGYLE
jgi:predicted AlkP superfamily phosphohydrolase/phosphomutase